VSTVIGVLGVHTVHAREHVAEEIKGEVVLAIILRLGMEDVLVRAQLIKANAVIYKAVERLHDQQGDQRGDQQQGDQQQGDQHQQLVEEHARKQITACARVMRDRVLIIAREDG